MISSSAGGSVEMATMIVSGVHLGREVAGLDELLAIFGGDCEWRRPPIIRD